MIHMRPSVPPISSLVEPTPMPSSEDDDLELNPKLSQHVKVPAKRKKNTLRSEGPRLQFENGPNGSGSVPAKKKHKVQTNAEASGSGPARPYSHSYSASVPTTNTNTNPRRPLSHDTPLEPLSPPRASAKTQPQTWLSDPSIPLATSSSKTSNLNSLSQSKLTFRNDSGALTKSRFTATPKPIPLPKKGRRRPMSNPPSPEPEESFPMPSLTAPAGSSRRGMFDRDVFQSRFSVGAPRSAPATASTNTVKKNKVERRALTMEVIDLTGPDGDDPGSKKDLRADSEEQMVIEVTDSDDESMVKRRLGNSSVADLKTGKEESTAIIEISDGEDEQQYGVAEPLLTEDEPLPISFDEDQSESFQNNTPVGERVSAQSGDVPPNSSEREEHKEHAEVRTGNSTGPEARSDSPRVEEPLEQQDNLSPTETETGEDMNETIRRTSLTSDPVELRQESGIPRSEVAQAREIKEESETVTLLERDELGLAQEIIDLTLSDGGMAEDEEDMGERSKIPVDMDTQQDPPEEPGLAVEIELQPGCESIPDVQTSASSIPILPKPPAIESQIPAKAKQNSLHLMERLRMGGNWKSKQKKIDGVMLEKDQETLQHKEMAIDETENGNEQADKDTSTIEQVRIPEILEKNSLEWRHVRQLRKLRAMASELGRPASALSSRVRRSYDDQEVYELEYAGPSEPEIERDTRSSSPVHSSTRTSSPARSTSQVGCPSTPESSSPAGFPSLPRSPSPYPPPRTYQPVFDPDVRYARDLSSSMYDYFNSYDDDFHAGAPGHMRRVLEAVIRDHTALDEPDAPPIMVINDVDSEPAPPWEFYYTNLMWLGDGIDAPRAEEVPGCDCVGGCQSGTGSKCACLARQQEAAKDWGVLNGGFAYDSKGKLHRVDNIPIFECNSNCSCSADECRNRVVQHGRKYPINIQKTTNKGWGVFSPKKIPRGSFVGVYSGELLKESECERRGHAYDMSGRTYLLDIDFYNVVQYLKKERGIPEDDDEDVKDLGVDAYHVGNFTRFLNNSCDPNCKVLAVYIDQPYPRPLLTLFTTREVLPGEELCFSYAGAENSEDQETEPGKGLHTIKNVCYCGAARCKGYMFKC